MKTLSTAGAIATLLASPVLATPIDAVTIEAILGALQSARYSRSRR
jgi:hypothetical protein